jgi:hypothetical protein
MANLGANENLFFFAIYSVPIRVLEKVDFWEPEVIAEDAVFFIKCFAAFGGDFQVIPFYGIFQGDAVEAEDYFESISGQYKQLQRWAWGGVESLPYLIDKMFFDKTVRKANKYSFDTRKNQTLQLEHLEFQNSQSQTSQSQTSSFQNSDTKNLESIVNISTIKTTSLESTSLPSSKSPNLENSKIKSEASPNISSNIVSNKPDSDSLETKSSNQGKILIPDETEVLIKNPTVPLRSRIRIVSFIFNNHFFWSTVPFTLFVATNLPKIFYQETQNQQIKQVYLNLSVLSTYLAWMSVIFMIFSIGVIVNVISQSYNQKKKDLQNIDQKIIEDLEYNSENNSEDWGENSLYQVQTESDVNLLQIVEGGKQESVANMNAKNDLKNTYNTKAKKKKFYERSVLGLPITVNQAILVWIQFILSPIIFIFACIPAVDAQIRGVLGKYMGYWVTPKK